MLFDLDGTLTDPLAGIHQSVNIALRSLAYPDVPLETVRTAIGPPLREAMALLGVTDDDLDESIVRYREHHHAIGMFNNRVIDGIAALLEELRNQGVVLAVATSKVEAWAREILEHFTLLTYFRVVAGAAPDGTSADKSDIVADCLLRLGDVDRATTIMIGDRLHDVEGAKTNGVRSVGVLWGYGSRDELRDAGADVVVATPAELSTTLQAMWDRPGSVEAII